MDFHKSFNSFDHHRWPPMLTALKSRRILVLTALAVVLLLAIFSQTLYHSDVTWDDVTQRISIGGGSSASCPSCKEKTALKSPGKFHYMIAASKPNKQFCRAIVSSAANRYGPSIVAGWHGEGELDAALTHLAKVRAVSNYLNALPQENDNDLFMLIDGYDVQLQLGPEVLIERYYQVVKMEDERLIQQLGPTHAERIAGPLGRHVMFGADKICWPTEWKRPACWAVPLVPGMDDRMYGPKTDGGEMKYFKPRWLNSGTIMGPVKETRDFFQATIDTINSTWNQHYPWKNSDQFYMADVWAMQELDRIKALKAIDPKAWHPKGPEDAIWPELEEGKRYNFHIAMDYWSHLFQTWAGYGQYVDWRKFDGPGFSKMIDQNVRGEENFKKWDLHLEGDAIQSIDRIFRSTDAEMMPNSSDALIRSSEFGTNVVTKTTLPVFHCTGGKDPLNKFYPRMWFFKYARPLIRSAVKHLLGGEPFAPYPIDGRLWYPAMNYPEGTSEDDAGAWSDGSDPSGKMEWLDFESMCAEFDEDIF